MTAIDQVPTTRRAGAADRGELCAVLSAAFLDDPVMAWCYPDAGARRALLPGLFDAFADAFARHDETYAATVDGAIAGVAMWAPSGVAAIHDDDAEAFGARMIELSGAAMARMGALTEIFEATHPHEAAWYLQFLGVEPAHQGKGIGSRLLRAVLAEADQAGQAAYLEATCLRNRALYERHGFACMGDLVLPDGPTAYAMWRDPAG